MQLLGVRGVQIGIALFVLQQFAGINAVMYFSTQVFSEVSCKMPIVCRNSVWLRCAAPTLPEAIYCAAASAQRSLACLVLISCTGCYVLLQVQIQMNYAAMGLLAAALYPFTVHHVASGVRMHQGCRFLVTNPKTSHAYLHSVAQ